MFLPNNCVNFDGCSLLQDHKTVKVMTCSADDSDEVYPSGEEYFPH